MEGTLVKNPDLQELLDAIELSGLTPAERNQLVVGTLHKILSTGWFQIAQIRSQLNTPNQSRSERQARREDRKLLNSNLSALKANLKLGKATLAKMNILPVIRANANATFSYYILLPPEVQAHILSFIDDKVHKLNVMRAIPHVDQLMRWDKTVILIPELLEGGNWRNLEQLRNTSPYIRDAINKRLLPQFLTQKLESHSPEAVFPLAEFHPRDRWTTLDPITAQVVINVARDNNVGFVRTVLQPLEEWVGPRIADCYLDCVDNDIPDNHLIPRISRCLERMPNLQRLLIGMWRADRNVAGFQFETDWEDIENLAMPALPSLKILVFREVQSDKAKVVRRKLLQTYGHHVNQVVIDFGVCDFDEDLFQHNWPQFPQLTTWILENSPIFENGWKFHCDMMERLRGSPLKIIRIAAYICENDEKNMVDLLEILGANFGKTLEQLSIQARDYTLPSWQKVPVTKWQESLGNLTFPKVTYLAIEQSCPECWDFLLFFPALEKLVLTEDLSGIKVTNDRDGIVELSTNLNSLRNANIWKLFPNLQEIEKFSYATDADWVENGMFYMEPETISRQDCITATAN